MRRDIILIFIASFLMVNCFPSLDRAVLEYVSIINILQRTDNRPQNGEVEGMPTFSPSPGEFYQEINISRQTTLADSRIYFTLDGTNPSCPITDAEGNTSSEANGQLYSEPIHVPQPTLEGIHINAIACGKIDKRDVFSQISNGSYTVTNGLLDPPTRDLAPGIFTTPQTLSLTAPGAPPGVQVRFTEDGTIPNCDSGLYTAPISINTSRTIRAISCLDDWSSSSVLEGYYEITGTVQTPDFSIESNTFNNDQLLTLSTNTTGANIRYAIAQDGDPDPTLADCNDGVAYTGPITLNWDNTRLVAIGCRDGWADSGVSPMRTYNFQVLDPVLSPVGGVYQTDTIVSASSGTSGATISYSTGGTALCGDSTVPVELFANQPTETVETVSARACRNGYIFSNPVSANYTITGTLPLPTATPDPTIVQTGPINVTLDFDGNSPAGSTIRFTTNGTTPNCDLIGSDYSAPIPISATTEIQAIDCKLIPAWNPSPPLIATYSIVGPVANPTFTANPDLEGGIYANDQTVTINTATPGADIFYSIGDGTQAAPDCSGMGIQYTSAITISNNTTNTIKAIGCLAGYPDSDVVVSNTFTLQSAEPEPGLPPGNYFEATNLFFTSTTTGATIHYRTDGNDPTCSDPNPPVSIPEDTGTITVKSIACKAGFDNSSIFSGVYNVTGTVANPTVSGPTGAGNFVEITKNTNPVITNQTLCFRIGSQAECSNAPGDPPSSTGGFCASGSNVYSDPIPFDTSETIYARSCSTGWMNSDPVDIEVILTGTLGNVAFSPDPTLEYNNSTDFNVTSTTSTIIYYTLDGSNPSCDGSGSSLVFSNPLTIDSNYTINAIACAPGYPPSAIVNRTTNFKVAQPLWSNDPGVNPLDNDMIMNWGLSTVGADYYFRVDGIEPDCNNPTAGTTEPLGATLSIPIVGNTATSYNFRAKGCKTGYTDSDSFSQSIDFRVSEPKTTTFIGNEITSHPLNTNRLDILFATFTTSANICYNSVPSGTPVSPTCNLDGTCASGTTFDGNRIDINGDIAYSIIGCREGYLPSVVKFQDFNLNSSIKRIFTTESEYNGNLSTANADIACNSDNARPSTNLNYKALRIGSDRNPTTDWVLDPSTNYFNVTGGLISETLADASGFSLPYSGMVFTPGEGLSYDIAWTGIEVDGVTGEFSAALNNCNDWTNGTSSFSGASGRTDRTNTQLFRSGNFFCQTMNPIFCVDEPTPSAGVKRIFITQDAHTGNMGGLSGVDALCNSDPLHPGGGANFKALLAANSPFRDIDNDWPLQANETYYQLDGTTVFLSTNASAEPLAPINSGITDPNIWIYHSFDVDYLLFNNDPVDNCDNYTNDGAAGGGGANLRYSKDGYANSTTLFIDNSSFFQIVDFGDCRDPRHIVCVEQ